MYHETECFHDERYFSGKDRWSLDAEWDDIDKFGSMKCWEDENCERSNKKKEVCH